MTLKIIFAGTPEFALPSLQALFHSLHEIVAVYTQPDRPAGRGKKIAQSPIKAFAVKNHLPCFQPKNFKSQEAVTQLCQLKADIMVVAAYGLILPESVLDAPRLGCINIHASLLPKWRGASPIQQAILSGDQKTGITLIQMNEGLDTGDMLSSHEVPILGTDTFKTLHDKLAQLGAKALVDLLPLLENQQLTSIPQNDRLATYASKIQKTDAKIDWEKSASVIERKIRAFNPFPIAYTFFNKQPLRIYQAEIILQKFVQEPGTMVVIQGEPVVVTVNGGLKLITVQLPGKKPIKGHDFVNAYLKNINNPLTLD